MILPVKEFWKSVVNIWVMGKSLVSCFYSRCRFYYKGFAYTLMASLQTSATYATVKITKIKENQLFFTITVDTKCCKIRTLQLLLNAKRKSMFSTVPLKSHPVTPKLASLYIGWDIITNFLQPNPRSTCGEIFKIPIIHRPSISNSIHRKNAFTSGGTTNSL